MQTRISLLLLLTITVACTQKPKTVIAPWVAYDESAEIVFCANNEAQNMRYKQIQSKILDKNELWKNIADQISNFSEEDYQSLKPLIFEQDIPSIQSQINSGKLSYEKLTQWYLYRIVKFENDKDKMLNAIVAINPNAVKEARIKDKNRSANDHPIYGMPVLLKDNVDAAGMPTTAGTHFLRNNKASDSYIVERMKEKGAIILGKTNLSEWANFLFRGGPNGFSAVGGQTLNPYGRKIFDTGGSSSGSGAAIAANYAAAAVGTETSGSILSPSSNNSLMGLKPTVGLLSRSGIVPLSSTLDTPGPMTRNIIDNAIFLSAMTGEDPADQATKDNPKDKKYFEDLKSGTLEGLRFGAYKNLLRDSIYKLTLDKLTDLGAIIIEVEPETVDFSGFSDLLSADMKIDLPNYLDAHASADIKLRSMKEIVVYNNEDTLVRIPYGQVIFQAASEIEMSNDSLDQLRNRLHAEGVRYFEIPMVANDLDAILTINNRGAGFAAAAKYPCLTIPMGYRENGQPAGLTFIARPFEEDKLLKMGYAFEQATKMRITPALYK
ncbi:MAG: amidase [Bacteroidetes bacterium HGW-Bacteroidetes-17]|jgi:amidase|nr:MAG: amidase [Bacteroidetes bacterium HGW-Bacteroidetes-17]